jgi:hypothetical protein
LEGFDEFGDEVDTQDLLEIDELLQARAKDQEASSILAQKPGGNDDRHCSTPEMGSTEVSQSTSLSQAQTLGGIDDRPCSTPEMGSAEHGQSVSLSQAQKPGGMDESLCTTLGICSAGHSQATSLSQAQELGGMDERACAAQASQVGGVTVYSQDAEGESITESQWMALGK